MGQLARFASGILGALIVATADARIPRSTTAKNDFKHQHPCPASGAQRGPCPGWVIDHIKPLCAGGIDAPINMQWQTKADSLVKDRAERALCRRSYPSATVDLSKK